MAFDLQGLLKTVAPALATALLGPLGGIAVAAIGKAVGMDEATQETLSARLQGATAEDLLALKKAEQEFQTHLKELDIQLETIQIQADVSDRKSAREREIAVKDWIPGMLAMLVTGGFFGVLLWMLKYGIPKDGGGSEALLVMLGALGTAWGAVISYFFGSSAQQVKQAAVLNKIASSP